MQLLQISWDVSPDIFSVGTVTLKYYGILFVLGFIVGYFILKRLFRIEGVSADEVNNLVIWSFVIAVLGARLGHVFFYEPVYYLNNPSKILKVWEGGVASHGAVIALLLFFWLYSRKKKWKLLWLLDRVTIPGALAASLIRIGNLMNSEIYGIETRMRLGFIFVRKGETIAKHPTQIYEALAYFSIFIVLLLMYNTKKKTMPAGIMTGWLMILSFSSRFLIEFFKQPQVAFEENMFLNMGQLLSVPFILTGIILVWHVSLTKQQTINSDSS